MSNSPHRRPRERDIRIELRLERSSDIAARERLLDASFGANRFAKTSERLREERLPASGLAFVACHGGRLIGTVRLWQVTAGTVSGCLLLGPLAVAAEFRDCGIGATLMWRALHGAKTLGHQAILLVGDADYYNRFGFSAGLTGELRMPGPYERDRLLGCELVPGALKGARGVIKADSPPLSLLSGIIGSVGDGRPAIAQPA